MAILQTCCCWHSVRTGSYASAAYTMVYFSLTATTLYMTLEGDDWGNEHLEQQMPAAAGSSAENSRILATIAPTPVTRGRVRSFLEPQGISKVTVCFEVAVLMCALTGLLTSLLLLVGLYTDRRSLLVPWVFTVIATSAMDLGHTFYLFLFEKLRFDPLTGIVLTFDFFLLSLNVYCLLCVISQYQEYKAGRGTAYHQQQSGSVRYVAQPSAPTCATALKKPAIRSSDTLRAPSLTEVRASPSVSPTVPLAPAIQSNGMQSLVSHRTRSVKRVQFPDHSDESSAVCDEGAVLACFSLQSTLLEAAVILE